MIYNYIKIALRIFLRHKLYVAINLLSLGFALACCIWSYLNYNFRESFDANYVETESIYRINSLRDIDHSTQPWAVTPVALAEAARGNLTGVKQMVRLYGQMSVLKKNDDALSETIHYADPQLFNIFNFPLKYGNFKDFKDKSVVISEALALKYFNNELPLGKVLTIINTQGIEEPFTVVAVLNKIPVNSSFQFDIVAPFENLYTSGSFTRNDWKSPNLITTFIQVEKSRNLPQIEEQLSKYKLLHNRGKEDWKINDFYLQPFKSIAFSSDRDMAGFVNGSQLNANPRGVGVFVPAIMSLFILLITCFNFTNISVAFASRRLKEIGIRKVVGGIRLQLICQFLTENLILCLLASLLANTFLQLLLPSMNNLTGLELQIRYTQDPTLWVFLLLLPATAAIVAGMYPALYISSFPPIGVLKGDTLSYSSNRFSRILLTVQLGLSCLALITGIILTQNSSFQKSVDYGYDLDKVAVVEVSNPVHFKAMKDAVSSHPKVETVAGTAQQIGDGSYQVTAVKNSQEIKAQMAHIGGESYLQTMGIRLIAGRHFFGEKGVDRDQSVIVNQTLVNAFHLQNPLGEQIKIEDAYFTIVGVVEDYKEYGLHGIVPPCILRLATVDDYRMLVVRTGTEDMKEVTQFLQASWHTVAPGIPYKGYLQSELTSKEKSLNEGLQMVAFFMAVVTMVLSASGLFALVSLNVIRRTKEIGIRKVLGASIGEIITLINKDFIRLMLIAFTIGSLLGYLFINNLLFKFIYVYHPQIGPGAFVITFLVFLFSCAFTVGIKVYSSASANPIKALRND